VTEAQRTALVVGCGYTGIRLAHRLRDAGLRVVGTSRSADRGREMLAAGIEVVAGDLRQAEILASLGELRPSVVAYCAPPQAADDPLAAILAATSNPSLEAFLYASSSSVYGDRDGAWVDENTAIAPDESGDPERYAAERIVVRAGMDGIPTRVCRITGIYGPGRMLRHLLESGQYSLIEAHDPWVNRIHVDDLVAGLIAACESGRAGAVYNMVDERPHRASEFANLAADLNRLPRPALISEAEARARYDAATLRRKLASKRVRCSRLREELGVRLKYPDYRAGLAASATQEQRAKQEQA